VPPNCPKNEVKVAPPFVTKLLRQPEAVPDSKFSILTTAVFAVEKASSDESKRVCVTLII